MGFVEALCLHAMAKSKQVQSEGFSGLNSLFLTIRFKIRAQQ